MARLEYFTWRNTENLNEKECHERAQELVKSLMKQYNVEYYELLPKDEEGKEYKVVLYVRDESNFS